MWPKSSKRFWIVKSAFFAVFFPALIVGGLLILYGSGLAGPGRSPNFPWWLQIVGWMDTNPVRPSFSAGTGITNLLVVIGVNALIWSYLLSLLLSLGVSGIVWVVRRGRADAR